MFKNFVIVAVLAVVALGVYFTFKAMPGPGDAANETALAADPKNASYEIEGRMVQLVDGMTEEEVAPGSASKNITRWFGNEAHGDFDGNGMDDMAFLLTNDGGGTGTFFYLVAALRFEGGWRGTNAVFLGDRIAPQTTNWMDGRVIVNYATRAADEPMTERPSIGVSKYVVVRDGRLIEEAPVIGGQKDEHGCLPAAGYSWCAATKKCIRFWEETCYASDAEAVRYALAEKYGKAISDVVITVTRRTDTHMAGGVKFTPDGSGPGGIFLAMKTGYVWQVVFDGNGAAPCEMLEGVYEFPREMLVNICY